MHVVTCKLNKDARIHQSQNGGTTFFVSLGEKNYNYQTKQSEWTNYEAAIFAKDNQAQFHADNLRAGAIITVTGKGLLVQTDPSGQYPPKLTIQDARLSFVSSELCATTQQQPQQAAPKMHAPAHPNYPQQAPPQMAPQQAPQMATTNVAPMAQPQQAPQAVNSHHMAAGHSRASENFDDDIPF